MERLDIWKQASPKDQAVVILMALEGHTDNLVEGISKNYNNLYNLIEELKILTKRLPDTWEDK